MCKSICEAVLAAVIVVVALIQMNTPQSWALWVILIAGVISLIHSFTCKSCFGAT
mgnify:FL=1